MQRIKHASEPHQRPLLRMQVSWRSCRRRRQAGPWPCPDKPSRPYSCPPVPGGSYGEEGLTRFLGSNSPQNQEDKRGTPQECLRQEATGKQRLCAVKSSNRWKQVRCGPQPQTLNHPDAPFQCSLKHGGPKISQTFDRMGQSENQMRLEKC